jgi:hypothetical protein
MDDGIGLRVPSSRKTHEAGDKYRPRSEQEQLLCHGIIVALPLTSHVHGPNASACGLLRPWEIVRTFLWPRA